MKIIIYDTVPCWWKLGWSPADNSLRIDIAKAFIAALPPIPDNSPLILRSKQQISDDLFASFSCDLKAANFGFNRSIKRIGEQDSASDFATFAVLLPKVYIATGKACQDCGGTGERDAGMGCLYCGGSKVEMLHDWDTAYNITKSLQLLFWLLELQPETEMATQIPQWLELSLCAERDMHGSSLGGYLSKDGLQLFNRLVHSKRRIREVEKRIKDALIQAWKHMMEDRDDDYNLRAEIRDNANLFLTCPGDAAGVYIVNERHSAHGCQIDCHNMDNPAQALACLAGLGVFCEELEKMWCEQKKTVPA